MLKAGTETGSLINHVLSYDTQEAPEVGMGATILKWTDRQACTIIKVSKARITVQYDKVTRLDKGMSDSQQYTYEPDPSGPTRVFAKTKRGWRELGGRGMGNQLLVGRRDHYHDFSF